MAVSGEARSPCSEKMTGRLVIHDKNQAEKGGVLSLSGIRFIYALYIFIIYIF
jgi:hypothetical protein